MKRLFLLFLTVILSTVMMAEKVTSEQALEQARNFIQKREASGSRPRRGASAAQQLSQARQVSGLYVFNIASNGGYVIVSNDDVALPILGYSDSGSIDPDNMPENMKAWLQGYADEIAWAKEHNIPKASATGASRRAGSHPTTAVGPLLTTTWYQNYPYNAAVADVTGHDLATGCVATAMAQVMCYTEKKAGNNTTTTTKNIPAYKTSTYRLNMPAIPAGSTLNWGDMIDNYSSGSPTDAQKTAVANLMLYCGCSVEMDYDLSSSAQASWVAVALKDYFGYESTAQYLSRSYYSYADWTDLIYHELAEGRPVVYGGQSVDNGHCFVCDGYMYDEGDLFHINWGWGGVSDGYFVLSVLNPSEQGIGGSVTNSAYNSGQEAVVGIQKIGGTGTVLPVTPNTVSLELKSTSASHAKIALGESIDVTVKVTNNSSDDYDGEICLVVNGALGVGKMFEIPAGATQNCVITFTPSATGSYTLGAAIPKATGGYTGEVSLGGSFTVVDQTPTDITIVSPYYWTADVGWTNVGGATKWNLRKRTVTMIEENFNGSVTGWDTIDWNGDGITWSLSSDGGIGGTPCYASPSYKGGNLNPDDGLITPKFAFGGSISFYAKGNNEYFVMYISINGENFYPISNVVATTGTWTKYEFDLSAYAGYEGWVVIDHCNSKGHISTSYLYVDDVTFMSSPGEWTTTSNVTANPYTLDGLSASQGYEVQVQSVNNDGGNWSSSVFFTTASDALTLLNDDSAADPNNTDLITAWDGHAATLTLSGRSLLCKNQWNTCCLPIDLPVYLLGVFGITDVSVKVLDTDNTSLSDDGKLTLKFKDELMNVPAGTPFIIKANMDSDPIALPTIPSYYYILGYLVYTCTINGDDTNMTQTSSDGKVKFVGQWSTFDITSSNINEIVYFGADNKIGYSESPRTLKCFRAHLWIEPKDGGAGARTIEVDYGDGTTSIYNVPVDASQSGDGTWYSLDGIKLYSAPAKKGVYIKNGKKVMVK